MDDDDFLEVSPSSFIYFYFYLLFWIKSAILY